MKDKLIFIVAAPLAICLLLGVGALGSYLLDGGVWLSSHSLSGTMHTIITIILVVVAIVLYVIVVSTNSFWLFNRWMLLGAVIGFLIGFSVDSLVKAANHKGTGFSVGGRDNDEVAEVSESQYKQEKFGDNGIMLGLGVLLWAWVAWIMKNKAAEAKAKAD